MRAKAEAEVASSTDFLLLTVQVMKIRTWYVHLPYPTVQVFRRKATEGSWWKWDRKVIAAAVQILLVVVVVAVVVVVVVVIVVGVVVVVVVVVVDAQALGGITFTL